MKESIKDIAARLAQPIAEELDLELVDTEYKKEGKNWYLRVFVDSPSGVHLEDCGRVSERLSEQLDDLDPVQEAYYLEVSSPGAERPLNNEADIRRSVGKNVYVTTYEPVEGEKAFEGKLSDFKDGELLITTKQKQSERTVHIPYSKVAKARLAIIF